MARFLLLSLLLVALVFRVSDAESWAEVYWRSVLPSSPMPSAIRDLISSNKAAVPASSKDNVGSTFFLEKSLQPGSTMALQFSPANTGALLPASTAALIPFNLTQIHDILYKWFVGITSGMASSMKKTLAECEANALPGEVKTCATSLESMVDFAMSGLKSKNIRAMSTSVSKAGTPLQKYTITGLNKIKSSELVACHAQEYAYAVFHCHTTTASAYTVSMVGADGTKVQALAACHMDAAAGVAEAYKKLGLEPGSVPVCHFLPQSDLLWTKA